MKILLSVGLIGSAVGAAVTTIAARRPRKSLPIEALFPPEPKTFATKAEMRDYLIAAIQQVVRPGLTELEAKAADEHLAALIRDFHQFDNLKLIDEEISSYEP